MFYAEKSTIVHNPVDKLGTKSVNVGTGNAGFQICAREYEQSRERPALHELPITFPIRSYQGLENRPVALFSANLRL